MSGNRLRKLTSRWDVIKKVPAIRVVALAFGMASLVLITLTVYVGVENARLPKPPPSAPSLVFREGEDHPVTLEMSRAAKVLGGAKAPEFQLADLKGTTLSLESLTYKQPLLLFFVELQCPCCKGAKPYIDRIQNYYGDVCNVVGVIDAGPKMAQVWSNLVVPQFRIIPDPNMNIIRSFKAERGVYTTLIAPGGRIVKAYPGYSQSMLDEISTNIARLAGIKKRPMPLAPAPKRMTSGCIFPGTKLSGDEL